MKSLARAVAAACVMGCAPLATAGTVNVFLDEASQGKGNKGLEFRPVDELGSLAGFLMTARTMVASSTPTNLLATGSPGTVYIDKGILGAGVQTAEPNGSTGISGGGGHKDEELIFTFDAPVAASSLTIAISGFTPGGMLNGADPILFIDVAGGSPVVMNELAWLPAFTVTGSSRGTIDFGLLGLGAGAMVESFRVRETNAHSWVNLIGYGGPAGTPVPVPAPLALGAAGLGVVAVIRRRMKG